jgi:hypothetical protein
MEELFSFSPQRAPLKRYTKFIHQWLYSQHFILLNTAPLPLNLARHALIITSLFFQKPNAFEILEEK